MKYSLEMITQWAEEHGCPFYIYDTAQIITQIQKLTQSFEGYSLLYSLKCNNHPQVLRCMVEQGLGVDAASANEVLQAVAQGCTKEHILYSAPAKSEADIRTALPSSTLIADSYTELERINALCAKEGVRAKVGLRISPKIAFSQGHHPLISDAGPDKFGVSEEELLAHKDFLHSLSHCQLTGFHLYVRSQNLNPESLGAIFQHAESLAHIWSETLELPLEYINFGGGFGIPYAADLHDLDLSPLQNLAAHIRTRLTARYPNIQLYMESGRFLVAQAGTFVTQIVDIKKSRGKTFVLAPGFLHGFLRPAMAGFVQLLSTQAMEGPCEPLWSGPNPLPPLVLGKQVAAQKVTVCGNLCTALDTVHRDITLENIALGNYMLFPTAGAYGAVLSPHAFSSHAQPAVVIV